MLRLLCWTVIGAILILLPAQGPCNEFTISVEVVAPGQQTATTTGTLRYPSRDPVKPRTVFKSETGRRLTVTWKAENTGDGDLQDALIHFFVVKQDHAGQREVPDLGKDVLHEGALTMDFMPAERSTGKFTITFDQPGSYLVRVETRDLAASHGHDHYAALDVVVE